MAAVGINVDEGMAVETAVGMAAGRAAATNANSSARRLRRCRVMLPLGIGPQTATWGNSRLSMPLMLMTTLVHELHMQLQICH